MAPLMPDVLVPWRRCTSAAPPAFLAEKPSCSIQFCNAAKAHGNLWLRCSDTHHEPKFKVHMPGKRYRAAATLVTELRAEGRWANPGLYPVLVSSRGGLCNWAAE